MSLEQRQQIIVMIDQARGDGARLAPACETAEIDPATYRRWQCAGQVVADRRATAQRPEPRNKLSAQERERVPAAKPDRAYTGRSGPVSGQ